MSDPRIESYEWRGGREPMLRFGPEDGPVVVAALPLLEEANRMRATVVAVLRALAERGVGGLLPELPGQGESLVPTDAMRLADLRAAFAAAAGADAFGLAVRSGALLDTAAGLRGRWHLAPQTGAEAVREWRRIGGDGGTVAGHRLSPGFGEVVAESTPFQGAEVRVVRLSGDPRPADRIVAGPPPWRAVEPGVDPSLVQILAEDIADWVRTCGG